MPFGGLHAIVVGDHQQSVLFHRSLITTTSQMCNVDSPGMELYRMVFNCGFELTIDERCVDPSISRRNDRLGVNAVSEFDVAWYNQLSQPDCGSLPADATLACRTNDQANAVGRRMYLQYLRSKRVQPASPGTWRERNILCIVSEFSLVGGGAVDPLFRDYLLRMSPKSLGNLSGECFVILGDRCMVLANQNVVLGVGRGTMAVPVDVLFNVPESTAVFFSASLPGSADIGGGVHCVHVRHVLGLVLRTLDVHFRSTFYFGSSYDLAASSDVFDRVRGYQRGEFPLFPVVVRQVKVKYRIGLGGTRKMNVTVRGFPCTQGHCFTVHFLQGMTLRVLYLLELVNSSNFDGLMFMVFTRVKNLLTDLRFRGILPDFRKFRFRLPVAREINRAREFLFDRTTRWLFDSGLIQRVVLSELIPIPVGMSSPEAVGIHALVLTEPFFSDVLSSGKYMEVRLRLLCLCFVCVVFVFSCLYLYVFSRV